MIRNVAIIGAGLSGLIAAQQLKDHCRVSLFDKSRGLGGRMSTRYAGDYEFDHGAQYFTARDPRFQDFIIKAIEQGVVAPWQGRAVYKTNNDLVADIGGDRFVAVPRMNSLAKTLTQGLDIKLGAKVLKLTRIDNKWTLQFEDGLSKSGFDFVICAVPSAQAQALLPSEFSEMMVLKNAQMATCFALMVGFYELHDFGWDSLRSQEGPAAWLAVNSSKPGRRKNKVTLIVHSAADWSDLHANADCAWVQSEMETLASTLCATDISKAPHRVLHRWLYASVSAPSQQAALYDREIGLVVCGDWCLGDRIEGAYLSGLAAADRLLNSL